MSPDGNLMGGCRLSSGGLHLGHYLGCLLPLQQFPEDRQYFFVIRDRPIVQRSAARRPNELIAILADLKATPFGSRIKPVLQSRLFPFYREMMDFFESTVTVNQIVNVHPRKKDFRRFDSGLSLADLMFPIESVCTYFVLSVGCVLMNDDNLRFVKFAKHLHRKVGIAGGPGLQNIPVPRLCHGPVPRIHGFDYRKMSKANGNCIFLSDSDDTLAKKISRLMHFKYLFRENPNCSLSYANDPSRFYLPVEYLPFEYLQAFGAPTGEWKLDDRLRGVDCQIELKEKLTEVLVNHLIRPIRERSDYYRTHQDQLWKWLEMGTLEATNTAESVKQLFGMKLLT